MKRKIYFGSLAFVFLLLATGLFIAPVQAVEAQKYRASFYCIAMGECLVAPKYTGNNLNERFIGRGAVAFAGSAKVDQLDPNSVIPYTWYGSASGILAWGSVFASWGKQTISVVLYSNGEAGGLVVDEGVLTDCLGVGTGPGAGLLLYKGSYRDSAGTHTVNGKARVSAWLAPGQTTMYVTQVILYNSDNMPFFGIIWFNVDVPSFSIHAANYFASSVKIDAIP